MAETRDRRGQLTLDTDVLVVGGGAAGVAAAFTAAKAGARVLLLEKYGFCGGAAVAGLSGTVCGLYAATEGAGKPPEQVVFGFADRFIAKGRFERRMEAIPVKLINHPQPGLYGAAAAFAKEFA